MVNIIKSFKVGELPAPQGYEKNIGVANMLCGIIDNKIILGGGENFPYKSVLDGGDRVIHKFLYLIRPIENSFHIIDKTEFERPVAYGSTVEYNNIIFYVGGNRILKINVINNKLHLQEYVNLPFNIERGIAHIQGGIIYYGLGCIDGEYTNRFFSFNIFTKENIELPSFPASGREHSVSAIFGDEIVVFGGANQTAYTEGYKYNIKKKIWTTIGDVEIDGEKISVIAAGYTKIDDDTLVVVGGFAKERWDEANYKLSHLRGEEKQEFRKFYFTQELDYYNWNKKLLFYNHKTETWSSPGDIDFNPNCGNALVLINNSLYSIMGEIKPGIRTPEIHRIVLDKLNYKEKELY
ncbi:cyclically-permuted mutarotase family protein [Gemella sp. zg-1178]|uniref:cyclically-permuted mutarotase family protein n=1 Tax=Gemella sp. zg-1178 TaxID=2840372 RepID=UPI001C03D0B9|nr:cyclically-permuted mutarotase family protein [Gemella sp. zg-1178]MBU0278218.1 cyclically-permuted mutarotase family protein [Gemella sp. zg-1178]